MNVYVPGSLVILNLYCNRIAALYI